ncbi:MAG: thioredoxin domain-containing protein [Candidatus Omnitrophota bacterium]|nr:thioredoxin domain-containing protein [Candidatus Omnitrophota bacterium]
MKKSRRLLLLRSLPLFPMRIDSKRFRTLILGLSLCLAFNGIPLFAAGPEEFSNRLVLEKSPYLLQHAHNPVDWYPWGEEAFAKAKAEDKPIFLSVGYSTCHWCHVMEDESFSDTKVAEFMNENFVAIKVDREERPDVDQIYMEALRRMTGSGGWPMNVFLTPEKKPFYGGTYFPPDDRYGSPGFATVLKSVSDSWNDDERRTGILRSGEVFFRAIRREAEEANEETEKLDEAILKEGYDRLVARFDEESGGFGPPPKFPRAHSLSFLLRYWKRSGEEQALAMVEQTLLSMAAGGLADALGGGFHRYSTDAYWKVPHFEKMLYDQAILGRAYVEAYQATRKTEYAQIARGIFNYVLRDMTDPHGAFYSAEDADSAVSADKPDEKTEGVFYLWADQQVVELLGAERGEVFNYYYGVEAEESILHTAHTIKATSVKFGKPETEIRKILREAREKLFQARVKRVRPHLDDKVLADWNGLMISTLAYAFRVLDEPRYRDAARAAADVILEKMKRVPDGRLLHRFRDGEAAIGAFIDDYAFLSNGLLDLYEATFEARYLAEAVRLLEEMISLFADKERGGFYFSAQDAETIITRNKVIYDGAHPSGNSIAALALFRAGRITMNKSFALAARRVIHFASRDVAEVPDAYTQMLMALDFDLGPSREIVIAGSADDEAAHAMVSEAFAEFLPNKVVVFHPAETEAAKAIQTLSPFVEMQVPINGKATAYVCKNYVCDFPTNDLEKFKELLAG